MTPFIHQEVQHILSSAYRSIPSMGEGSNSTASDSSVTPKSDSIRSPEDNSNASESSSDMKDRISAIEEIEQLIKNLGPPGNLLTPSFF